MRWVPWIALEGDDTANEAVRAAYDVARNPQTGAVPDLVRLTGRTPQVARLLHELSVAVYRDAHGLTLREKEITALVVSSYIGCVH
jgi:alkylhydroperoxidase family enzyme